MWVALGQRGVKLIAVRVVGVGHDRRIVDREAQDGPAVGG